MADSIKKITVQVQAIVGNAVSNIDKFTAAVKRANDARIDSKSADSIKKIGNEAEHSAKKIAKLEAATSKLKGIVAGALTASAILGIGQAAVAASGKMELLRKGLEYTLGKQDTSKLIKGIQEIGEKSAYDTNQLIPMSRAWINMGESADQAMGRIQKLVDLGSAFGLTTDQIEHANLALSQMAAAGKINAQDMMQLTNAGIPSWKMLADAMGMSVTQVRELAAQGKLTGDAINALWDTFEAKTKGAATTLASSLMGQTSNIEEAITNSMAVIGDIIRDAFDIQGILAEVGVMVEGVKAHLMNIKEAAESIGMKQAILNELSSIDPVIGAIASAVVSAFTTIKETVSENIELIKALVKAFLLIKGVTLIVTGLTAALGALSAVMNTLKAIQGIWAMMQAGIIGVRTAFLALTAAMNVNPIVLAITLVCAALVMLYTHWDDVKSMVESAVNKIKEVVADALGFVVDFLENRLVKGVKTVGDAFVDFASMVLPSWASDSLAVIGDMVDKACALLKSLADYARNVMNGFRNAVAVSRSAAQQELDPEERSEYAKKAHAWINVPETKKPSVGGVSVGAGKGGKGGGGGSKALSEEEKAIEALIKKYSDADKMLKNVINSEIEAAKIGVSMMSGNAKLTEENTIKLTALKNAHDEVLNGYEKELLIAEKISDAATRDNVINGINKQIDAENKLYQAKLQYAAFEADKNAREENTASFDREMQHIQNLMNMYQISADKRIELENSVLEARKTQLEETLAMLQPYSEEWIKTEQQLADTIQKIHANAAFNVKGGWQEALMEIANQQTNFKDEFLGVFDSIESGFVNLITATGSAKDRFKNFLQDVTTSILKAMTQIIIKGLITKAIMGAIGMGGGSVFSHTASGGTYQMIGNTYVGSVPRSVACVASGGYITGAGTSTSDSIPAMLSNGEYVLNAAAVKRIGVPRLNAMNHYASGGYVGGSTSSSAPNVVINVQNETGQAVTAKQGDTSFDGESYVIGVVLEGLATNKNGMRDIFKGVATT